MLLRSVVLAALAASLAIGVGVAVADPNPVNNKNAVSRTLECDNGATLAATFAGLEGSDFNIVIDQRVFVEKWIQIIQPVGGPADVLTSRGLQGISPDRIVTCGYTTGTGAVVTVKGFFTGPAS